jgi:hypothetical protein
VLSDRALRRLAELIKEPHVVGYSTEPVNTVAGVPGIRVFLGEDGAVDREIDGAPVEPMLVGTPRKLIPQADASATEPQIDPTKKVRPLMGGLEIRHEKKGPIGTLGYFVTRAKSDAVWLLSSEHVLLDSNAKANVFQPMAINDKGNLAATGVFSIDDPANGVDAGCARLAADVKALKDVAEIGEIQGRMKADVGQSVRKFGAVSRLTRGKVDSVDCVIEFPEGVYRHQIGVAAPIGKPFSAPGDSGSLVVDAGKPIAVGLLMGSSVSPEEPGKRWAWINPIGPVLDALGAKLY